MKRAQKIRKEAIGAFWGGLRISDCPYGSFSGILWRRAYEEQRAYYADAMAAMPEVTAATKTKAPLLDAADAEVLSAVTTGGVTKHQVGATIGRSHTYTLRRLASLVDRGFISSETVGSWRTRVFRKWPMQKKKSGDGMMLLSSVVWFPEDANCAVVRSASGIEYWIHEDQLPYIRSGQYFYGIRTSRGRRRGKSLFRPRLAQWFRRADRLMVVRFEPSPIPALVGAYKV